MLIHAQDFNIRMDNHEQLIREIRQELMRYLVDILDRVEVIEYKLKERGY